MVKTVFIPEGLLVSGKYNFKNDTIYLSEALKKHPLLLKRIREHELRHAANHAEPKSLFMKLLKDIQIDYVHYTQNMVSHFSHYREIELDSDEQLYWTLYRLLLLPWHILLGPILLLFQATIACAKWVKARLLTAKI